MFDHLTALPADPILGLMTLFQRDQNPRKVDLGVGVYKTETGQTPVLAAIKQAEIALLEQQTSKVYVGPAGNPGFLRSMQALLLGDAMAARQQDKTAFIQTPGGCGALRVAAELIKKARPEAAIWVSDPTWGNHIPLLGNAGIQIKTYPYFDAATNCLDVTGMFEVLSQVPAGDLVLLHGCCHNPTGVDLAPEHWQHIADLAIKQGFIPFVDMAYQGFGDGLHEDALGLRLLIAQLPEVVFAISCSKNFGLYRERVGALGVAAANTATANALQTHLLSIVRGIYSMPPDHGAELVARVLDNPELYQLWLRELADMRERIQGLREAFVGAINLRGANGRFDFIRQQKGMFSFLGLSELQVSELAARSGIYMLSSSRASIAGLNRANLDYVCDAIAQVW